MKKNKFIIIAGPCVIESREMLRETAGELKRILEGRDVEFYFKSSYKKANRTSIASFSGLGDKLSIEYLAAIRSEFNIPILTDVHAVDEATFAGKYVDAIQIPAFLSRQTELLVAAGRTGKAVNIKKGQFMAPGDMQSAAQKVTATGNKNVWLTERGTFFGYHDLVVDFRSLVLMREMGFPVIFDATHSVQKPSEGEISGGDPRFIRPLARAAAAIGIDGLFFETHPSPKDAKSDANTQLPLAEAEKLIKEVLSIVEMNRNTHEA